MKTETWKKVLTGLGIASAIGTLAGVGSWAIGLKHPETQNLPEQHVEEIKGIVNKVLDERNKKS